MGVGAAMVLAAMVINPVLRLIAVSRPGAIIAIGANDVSNAIANMMETRVMWPTIAPIMTAVCGFTGMLPTFLMGLLAHPFTYLFLLIL